ncbi:probable protein S-acyltransferase 22 [Oryza brachyantha]|uniref:S-acyltransferase n=1 Tax=Oryza brachyantha TaxID=4533 RepID=J3N1V3_ORYBR|nr:probable protein S-acyltransferase 22 [Oryza brachyantha]
MRKHGWQLPYHPLQVVAIAVFLALGFAFYVFFVPFVGRSELQYVLMGLYTPLITCVVMLYIWCAATNPGDPGIFKAKKHPRLDKDGKQTQENSEHELHHGGKSFSDGCSVVNNSERLSNMFEGNVPSSHPGLCGIPYVLCTPFSCLWKRCFHSDDQSSQQHSSEEGMFFCSLCEVEVLQHSKHCRVCDKCVDGFDHHCRWLNNCIGKRNYKRFFILMASAVLLLIMQWLVGILVLILCLMKRGEFSGQIVSKLGSSFSTAAFVIVVMTCTLLAMLATIPLAQLFCFHVLLIKKGITTYDYIVALREQEEQQEVTEHQSPQMSIISSVTGFSTTSSFAPLQRGSWCTPTRLFLEDQHVIPPEMPQNTWSKKAKQSDTAKRKPAGPVKISPWTLARLNAEEVSKAAAEAKKKSKVLHPIMRNENPKHHAKTRTDVGEQFLSENSVDPTTTTRTPDSNCSDVEEDMETCGSLAPLKHEPRSVFQPSIASSSIRNLTGSPQSSLDSPDLHPFRVSMSGGGADELRSFMSLAASELSTAPKSSVALSRSTSGGYEASGGEDSDRIPSKIVHRSSNWSNAILNSGRRETGADLTLPTSERFFANTRFS